MVFRRFLDCAFLALRCLGSQCGSELPGQRALALVVEARGGTGSLVWEGGLTNLFFIVTPERRK